MELFEDDWPAGPPSYGLLWAIFALAVLLVASGVLGTMLVYTPQLPLVRCEGVGQVTIRGLDGDDYCAIGRTVRD